MPNNDPLKNVENIVQLPSARRTDAAPASHMPRAQPTPAVPFTSWVAVRDRAAAALLGGAKRLLLTGPAGTGKTMLAEHVARVLRAAGRTVIIQLADADPAPPGPGVTLVVDEADRLSAAKLKQLFDEATGTIVLTGLAPLVRRVPAGTVQLTLEALGPADAQKYIAQWLTVNRLTSAELDSKAVRALVELSGGVPRLLSTLLAASSWLAKTSNAPVIEAVHIWEAAELRSVLGRPAAAGIAIVERPPVQRRWALWSALLTSVVLVGTGTAIAPHLFPAETEQAVALATPFVEQAERWLRNEPSTPPPPLAQASPVQTAAQAAVPAVVPVPIQAAPEPISPATPVEPAAAEPAPEPIPENKQEIKPPEIAPPVAEGSAPAAPPAAAPSPTLPIETIEFLLRRAREMLALDDLSAARLLFVRAAEGGSPEAMFELGQTFDPAFLTSIGAVRQSDRAEALRWYRRAAEKGNRAAERLLPKQ